MPLSTIQSAETRETRKIVSPPELPCRRLALFDAADLEAVRRAFRDATACSFQQTWLDETEVSFSPATVCIGWHGNSVFVFAELVDTDIFNAATRLNQLTWEMGDVFEMFFQPMQSERYIEFHVTPNNQKLQMSYADSAAVERGRKTGNWEHALLPREAFVSRTWIEEGAWNVLAEIPASFVCGVSEPVEGLRCRFSFGRYDYTRGSEKPVISSTSPHAALDFHRRQEWGRMTFEF